MLDGLRQVRLIKKLRRSTWYVRQRQRLPGPDPHCVFDDRVESDDAEVVRIEWPAAIRKPAVGIVQDYGPCPRWTKYRRLLENNGFEHGILDLHSHDWLERACRFDVVVGIVSSVQPDLQEMQKKYFFLEQFVGKMCYPSSAHALLYEDKLLEAYIGRAFDLPFAATFVTHNRADALQLSETLPYPLVSKIVPSSASVGVELIHNVRQCRAIIERCFSPEGRTTYSSYFRQKDYVYFQQYIPNDGFDIRAIVIKNWVFGYYRRVPQGDFRASGMGLVEKRELPHEAMRIAYRLNQVVRSPMLVVDMVHALDDSYYIIEFSPVCQIETPEQLHVNGVPGVYVLEDDGSFHFQRGRYWVHELALREFLMTDYLNRVPSPAFAGVAVGPGRVIEG